MTEREKDLTIAAYDYIKSEAVAPENVTLAYGDFINGAKWAFEYMEKNRLTACDNMTEEEAEREQRFVINFLKENDRVPTYSDAIEITRKETIEQTCEWLRGFMECSPLFEYQCSEEEITKTLKSYETHMKG